MSGVYIPRDNDLRGTYTMRTAVQELQQSAKPVPQIGLTACIEAPPFAVGSGPIAILPCLLALFRYTRSSRLSDRQGLQLSTSLIFEKFGD